MVVCHRKHSRIVFLSLCLTTARYHNARPQCCWITAKWKPVTSKTEQGQSEIKCKFFCRGRPRNSFLSPHVIKRQTVSKAVMSFANQDKSPLTLHSPSPAWLNPQHNHHRREENCQQTQGRNLQGPFGKITQKGQSSRHSCMCAWASKLSEWYRKLKLRN